MANIVANLGSAKLMKVGPSVYLGWLKDLITLHSGSAFIPAFVICMTYNYLFALQWLILAIVLFLWCIVVIVNTIILHNSFIGVLYPIHLMFIRPVLELAVLVMAMMSWKLRDWGKNFLVVPAERVSDKC